MTLNPTLITSSELHRELGMSAMIAKHDPLAALMPKDRPVAFLDYPLGVNVGDLLIMLGTLAFFERHGLKRRLSRSLWNTEAKAALGVQPGDTIAMQGGGNFGDLYPHIQAYRERIVADYPENRIVIMPQTVYFKDPEALKRSAERLTRHNDLTLVVRDQVSFDLAKPWFGERLMLAPDMAHQLWPTLRGQVMNAAKGKPKGPLFFMRVDEEQANGYPAIEAYSGRFVDWHDVVTKRLRAIKRLFMEGARIQTAVNAGLTPDDLYFNLIQNEVVRIAAKLVDHSPWITSRLHGFILGLLMDKPVVALDNSYGKLSSYINTWRPSISPIALVGSPAQAQQAADFARAADIAPDRVSWADYSALPSGVRG